MSLFVRLHDFRNIPKKYLRGEEIKELEPRDNVRNGIKGLESKKLSTIYRTLDYQTC